MENDLKKIKKDIDKLIEKLDQKSILGVIPYLESMLELVEEAQEELSEYDLEEE